MRYHGGKWKLAPWIIEHFPAHGVYVDPFGGAGSVLLRKPRSSGEVYNDLAGEVVNVFRVLRDPASSAKLAELLVLTPYARDEFQASYEPSPDPVEQARRTLVRAAMGIGTNAVGRRSRNGFRAKRAGGILPASEFANWPPYVPAFTARLRGVVIESRPALDVIHQYDAPDVLHYCDPPYLASLRTGGRARSYAHEMTDADHCELAAALHGVRGMAIVSGYASSLYADLYEAAGWRRVDRPVYADQAARRVESLWISPRADAACRGRLL
jgi:DNA adenine methylase